MRRDEIRDRIDTIDSQLVMLFAARMTLCEKLAIAKKELGLPVEDLEREKKKLEELKALVSGDNVGEDAMAGAGRELAPYVEELYKKIFELSKGYQSVVQNRCRDLLKTASDKAEAKELAGKTNLKFGLVGRRLGHSFSKELHGKISKRIGIEYEYDVFEVEPWELENFMDETNLDAFNVTIPHKKDVIKYCAQLSETVKRTGAANLVVREKDGWHAYNTDYEGFKYMVEKSGYDVAGKHVLVLGKGGASATAQTVLRDMGAFEVAAMSHQDLTWLEELSVQGRYMEIAGLDAIAGAQLIVNATPVGTYPNTEEYPLDLSNVWRVDAVLDVVYNPERTRLMMDAEARDKIVMGGLGMLVVQALAAVKICIEKLGSDQENAASALKLLDNMREDLIEEIEFENQNVVIIGMPGCGKTTVGRIVAEATGKTFIDSDEEIMFRTGKTIREIFLDEGEEGFRKIESEVLSDLGRQSRLVIATGGGCVTREENYRYLHQNGKIVWIQRRLDDLEIAGRPISEARPLEEIFEERKAQYEDFADVAIDGDGGKEATFRNLMAVIK